MYHIYISVLFNNQDPQLLRVHLYRGLFCTHPYILTGYGYQRHCVPGRTAIYHLAFQHSPSVLHSCVANLDLSVLVTVIVFVCILLLTSGPSWLGASVPERVQVLAQVLATRLDLEAGLAPQHFCLFPSQSPGKMLLVQMHDSVGYD
jgi:hypothetical protein